ncbi:eukaryotic translation initiation factor 3 subunit J [Pilobolus umbonatus]|nr:eukaryotic translation initiation factor 3 subunit J [Pilobolus umbonatus]
MSDWEEDLEVEVNVVIPKKNKWDDEDVEEDIKDSWEDSDDEKPKKPTTTTTTTTKKVSLKQRILEKQAAEEQKKKELEEKKLAVEEEEEEEESAYDRAQRMRQLELEADMMSATDLFSGVSLDDMKDKPLEEWKPKNRVEMDAYRKRLVEVISASSKSINYGWFVDELLRDIAVPLNEAQVKKTASTLTGIANEKQKQAKESLKKTKGKSRPQLAAAGKNSVAAANDDYDDYDDFM